MITTTNEAEIGLIGAALATNGEALDELALTGGDFDEPSRGAVFDAARKLREAGRGVDLVTLIGAVPESHQHIVYDAAGWSAVAYNVREWADLVHDAAVRRRVSQAGLQIAGLSPDMAAGDLVDRAQAIVSELSAATVKHDFKFVGELLDDVLVQVAEQESFHKTPWSGLDRIIGGFRPGAVYVVAARPGVGKSVVAAQIATALADSGAVAFSSLEMSAYELVQRFISERAQVNVGRLKNNRLDDHDFKLINSRREALQKLNIAIDDRTSISPSDVRAFARGLSRVKPLSGVVVDYLQLMSSSGKSERYAQVTEFSRQMKVLAKDFQVPVIVLSQLNRAVDSRTDGVPRLSDLRESGAIEQDADVVMLLRREESSGTTPTGRPSMTGESLIIDVAKNRHGQVFEVELDWQGPYSRAVDLE